MWNIVIRSHRLYDSTLQNFQGRYHKELAKRVINNKELDDEVLDKECECETGTRNSIVAVKWIILTLVHHLDY